jgi:hypothetical protein
MARNLFLPAMATAERRHDPQSLRVTALARPEAGRVPGFCATGAYPAPAQASVAEGTFCQAAARRAGRPPTFRIPKKGSAEDAIRAFRRVLGR